MRKPLQELRADLEQGHPVPAKLRTCDEALMQWPLRALRKCPRCRMVLRQGGCALSCFACLAAVASMADGVVRYSAKGSTFGLPLESCHAQSRS